MASTCLHYFQSDWIDFWNKGLCKQGSLNNLKIDVILFDLETQYLSSNLRLFFSLKLPLLFGIEVPLQAFTFSGSFVPISLKQSFYVKNWRKQSKTIFQFWIQMGPFFGPERPHRCSGQEPHQPRRGPERPFSAALIVTCTMEESQCVFTDH